MLERGVVDFEKPEGLVVKNPHRRGIAIEDHPVLSLALAQIRLSENPVADIAEIDDDAGDLRVRGPVRANRLEMTPGTVPMVKPQLQPDGLLRVAEVMLESLHHAGQVFR